MGKKFLLCLDQILLTRASLLIGITLLQHQHGALEKLNRISIIFLGILSISSAVGASLNAINVAKRDRSSSVIYYLRLSLLGIFLVTIIERTSTSVFLHSPKLKPEHTS